MAREMAERYDAQAIEVKWQARWEESGEYVARDDDAREKWYFLDMFAYPSGDLHWGHIRNYLIGDVACRYQTHRGLNVMHPTGFDAFGLPAENAAIKRGAHPMDWTRVCIDNMRRQYKRIAFGYDWSREIATCEPEYYRWNQWFFLRLLGKGLAYKKHAPVNWCPECSTALANEQVKDGACERCSTVVEKRALEQWFMRITEYADRLLEGHASLDWPEDIITMQRNWIGKSHGVEFRWEMESADEKLSVFTTRPDTVFGVTFMVLAPEHPMVERITTEAQRAAVEAVRRGAATMSEIDRASTERERKGAFTGAYAVNPMSAERVPIWVADYVMMDYGTGAIMAVPAHDQRDFEFARQYDIPIRIVIAPEGSDLDPAAMTAAYEAKGNMVNSGRFDGMPSAEGWNAIADEMEGHGIGARTTNYRLRDWCISRQRYWGTPIPVVYCEKCGMQGLRDEDLPVELPYKVEFSGTGECPLTTNAEFMNTTCPSCGGQARRDADTMDTFVDSSWYFLRYCSPREGGRAFDPERVRTWMPVRLYVGGREHATMHLMYARFFTMALHDMGLLDIEEPFKRLFNQGILTSAGRKMSKRDGGVPADHVINGHGADTARLFMLFMAPAGEKAEWGVDPATGKPYTVPPGVEGVNRFLHRLWRNVAANIAGFAGQTEGGQSLTSLMTVPEGGRALRRKTHQTIRKVTEDVERFQFNTAVSAMMELLNEMTAITPERGPVAADMMPAWCEAAETLARLMSPFAPHIACELWETMGKETNLLREAWPTWDEEVAAEEELEIPVQVNGKVRDKLTVPVWTDAATLEAMARACDGVSKALAGGGEIRKVIVVPGRLVNVVVG